jgi:protease PrsW
MLSLLALAVAPGAVIIFFIYSKDKYDREPLKNLVIAFLLGMASIIPAIFFESGLQPVLHSYFPTHSLTYYSIFAFLIVASSEEVCKFAMLRFYAYRHRDFNEPLDGIIYSVIIAMGFATLENINYVLKFGFMTGLLRMFLSVPAHAAFGAIMGYHVGVAKFAPRYATGHLIKGLLLAIFFHGIFDFFLFLQDSPLVKQHISNSLLLVGALLSYWIAIRMSLKSIRIHQALSKETFTEKNSLL